MPNDSKPEPVAAVEASVVSTATEPKPSVAAPAVPAAAAETATTPKAVAAPTPAPTAKPKKPHPTGVTVGQRAVMVNNVLVPMPAEQQTPLAKGVSG